MIQLVTLRNCHTGPVKRGRYEKNNNDHYFEYLQRSDFTMLVLFRGSCENISIDLTATTVEDIVNSQILLQRHRGIIQQNYYYVQVCKAI